MKYLISIIFLTVFFIYGQIMEKEFPLFLNVGIIIFIFLISFLWEYSSINKKIEADLKFRSQKKILFKYLLYPILWSLVLLIENQRHFIILVLLLWTLPFAEFVMYFVYKYKKPYTLFIKGNELIINKRFTQKRNLTDLTQIQFDRFSKDFKLDFKSKSEISISTIEYKTADIQKLLEIMIDKSEHSVFIPLNYKPNIKIVDN